MLFYFNFFGLLLCQLRYEIGLRNEKTRYKKITGLKNGEPYLK